jgi:hypothetical protein
MTNNSNNDRNTQQQGGRASGTVLVPLRALGSRLRAKIAYPAESADDVEAQTSGGTCSISEAGWQERALSDDEWSGRMRTRWVKQRSAPPGRILRLAYSIPGH